MIEVKVLNRQSLLDIALQETGTIEAAFEIAVANGISITDYVPGVTLSIPDSSPMNEPILSYYKSNNINPATSEDFEVVASSYVESDYWDEGYTN